MARMFKDFKARWSSACFWGTRTYHRMAVAIEDAGFEVRDMLEFIYASGFPKSLNIGKAVDKICGETGRKEKFVEWMKTTGLTPKIVDEKLKECGVISQTSNFAIHYFNLGQPAIPTLEMWKIVRPMCGEIPQWVDDLVERIEREREVIGENKNWGKMSESAKFTGGQEWNITKGNSEWEGFGTALKPAHEPICMARKPLSEKTIVENVLKHGTGAIQIDGCRIPTASEDAKAMERCNSKDSGRFKIQTEGANILRQTISEPMDTTQGRFPANVICSDDALNDGVMTKSGKPSGIRNASNHNVAYADVAVGSELTGFGDSGSKSRYFDLDVWAEKWGLLQFPKASKSERNEGCERLEVKQAKGGGGGIGDYLEDVNSASGKYGSEKAPAQNNHPTVKPVHLMAWLVRLVSKEGDTVLDPFMGSGTTGVACKKLNRNFIGIEKDQTYYDIAKERITNA